MNEIKEIDTGVLLPEDGVIDSSWARTQLERTDAFSKELMYYGKGSVFFLLKTELPPSAYEQAVSDLDYTVETSEVYIQYLQKRPLLEAIKAKYYTALSLSASEYITGSVEDALALCDVCTAKYGKLTSDNLRKAAEATGAAPKRVSSALMTIEKAKKKALYEWLLSEHGLSEDDIYSASTLDTSGKTEYLEKMLQAYSLLTSWDDFYDLVSPVVLDNGETSTLRFLSDMADASQSINEYLKKEEAYHTLASLKEEFANEVYPKLSFEEGTSNDT